MRNSGERLHRQLFGFEFMGKAKRQPKTAQMVGLSIPEFNSMDSRIDKYKMGLTF